MNPLLLLSLASAFLVIQRPTTGGARPRPPAPSASEIEVDWAETLGGIFEAGAELWGRWQDGRATADEDGGGYYPPATTDPEEY